MEYNFFNGFFIKDSSVEPVEYTPPLFACFETKLIRLLLNVDCDDSVKSQPYCIPILPR